MTQKENQNHSPSPMLSSYAAVCSLVASLSVPDIVSVAQKWSPVVTVVDGSPTLGASNVARYTRFITSAHEVGTHGVVHFSDSSLSIFLVAEKDAQYSFVASLTTANSHEDFQNIVCDVLVWYHMHSGSLVSVDDENMV